MGDEIFEEIQQTQANLTEKQMDKVREVANSAEANEDPHFLLLGRPAVGKSTFAGALTEGKFKGSSGPTSGTKSSDIPGLWKHIKTVKIEEASSTKSNGSNTKKVYYVSDTVGLGDVKVDLDEMKREAKEVCKQSGHCTVFLCIALEDRLDSNDTQIAFDVCNSLDIWENVIVVITKCDLVSPEIADDPIGIEKMRNDWKKGIEDQLELMNVDGEVIRRIVEGIVFSCHPKRRSLVDQSWPKTLMKALKGMIQRVGGAAFSAGISIGHNLLGEKLFASCFQPDVDYEVQDVTQPNQNIEDLAHSSQPQPEQSGLKGSQKKGYSQSTKAVIGGAAGGVGGAVLGGVAGAVIGAVAVKGGAAVALGVTGAAVIGGAAIAGALTGGIGLLVAGALIAYFLFK